ncbi:MAG: galactose-1-phosphate uridylyltransferase [Candidatus Scalindua sp.]|jgi:UDPglucose--hexose-1-phosphate uridylyltransferase|nr:galactose-1-phosphate uridylyltransferase [Candidatus Scalindua sp.]MBT5305746.1 galactose-1-phosphate uridylyltransferase [Candidatus Scalindua sp.]MBT6050477.1 galactose-1-phosphate uridylyltransferase [Candidatus Scalindua sp.]MBT6228008.1 galactose-1-phosphate uridylyltransferase [Candidatus Scalindua sp.]MBT6561442.1 galactose-1-phosphate uridylyltransferase [Candidatus Scalindua sp.]
MPELRREPISGRWVIVATERATRPTDFKTNPQIIKSSFCPFCEGNEDKTPPEILAYRDNGAMPNTSGWRVRVVPNKFPALQIEGDQNKRGEGIYDMMSGIGAHEVIIESPRHIQSLTSLDNGNVEEVLLCYRDRLIDLKNDKRFVYGLLFKNVGASAGASLDHTHSQLIVTPIVPQLVANEMANAKTFYQQRERCLFCDMIQQEIDTNSRLVISTDNFVAFAPFASRFPFEIWILPKKHESHFENLQKFELDELAKVLKDALTRLETALDLPPYNYIIHSAPFNINGSDSFHWHIEIIPRLTNIAGFEWGTGFYINPMPPEQAAETLRNAIP